MACPSSSYDVFLSFRGEDTRLGFTGSLYNALRQKGIHTFIDDEELQRGEQITPSLIKAIQESSIAITVVSNNYASSSFCLDELVSILDCKKEKGCLVLPVFYDVDPSDVRRQKGSFGEALTKHGERFKDDMEKVRKWRMALHQVANLSGWHFKRGHGYEYELIETIVKEVSSKINRALLHVAKYPVGVQSRVSQVNSLLDVGSDDGVHMVGIHGIGGIGKTTVARAVYNLIARQFEGSCFLADARANSNKHGLVHLQEKLLSEILGEDIHLGNVNEGMSKIKHRLCRKKVLVIVDDIDKREQLQAVVGGPDWFGSGSRVIITTRDKHLLELHGVARNYEVEELDEKEALELLSWNAFKNNKVVEPSYMDVLNRAVTYASGLPLALEVIGSNLFGKSIEEWKSALVQYEKIPSKDIHNILKVSFDALEELEKNIFLDIAFFLKGSTLKEVEDILCARHDGCMKYGIGVLVKKSLIKIEVTWMNMYDRVTLHDLIEDMGKEIVRQESPEEPGKRSRLWFHKDIVQVLEKNTGTSKIQIINAYFPKSDEEVDWDGEAFRKMNNLEILIIRNGHFSEGPKHLPNSLKVLEWEGYPSQSLPSNFHPKKLVQFILPCSRLTSLELPVSHKKFMNLKVLNFDDSEYITEIGDLSGVPNLEELSFARCKNLLRIHESVGFLDKLTRLLAYLCPKLRTFPPIKLTSLDFFMFNNCPSLENVPEILEKMENIEDLDLHDLAIKELPFSIRNLTRLRRLTLTNCGMVQLPSSIVALPELQELRVSLCKGLRFSKQDEGEEKVSSMLSSNVKRLRLQFCETLDEFFPIGLTWFANVKTLILSFNYFTILPACIKECHSLRNLYLNSCNLLEEIRGIPPNLETLYARYCRSLKDLDLTLLPACTKDCRFLRKLDLDGCKLLREIRGIPPNIELLSTEGCKSLTSSCRSMLLNQELHREGGNKMFHLPGATIPEWFEHRSGGRSISFWFRNKFPAISLCVVGEPVDKFPEMQGYICCPTLTINHEEGKLGKAFQVFRPLWPKPDHIFIADEKQIKSENYFSAEGLEIEWNHAVFSVRWVSRGFNCRDLSNLFTMQIGLHVFEQESSMEDIRFTNPYKSRKLCDDLISSELKNHLFLKENHMLLDMGISQIQRQVTQQQNNLAALEPHVRQGIERLSLFPHPALKSLNDNVNCDSNSMVTMGISSTTNVEGSKIASRKRKRGTLWLHNKIFWKEPSKVKPGRRYFPFCYV